jgi:HD-GYP domain-containing protein (c-di-GMP phosphodiesterase class II)
VTSYPYTLRYPVHNLDEKELLPAGTILSPKALERLRKDNNCVRAKTVRLQDHGTIKQDLSELLSNPPYNIIFSQREQVTSLMEIIDDTRLPLPVMDSLEYFKTHDFYTYRHMLLVFALTMRLARELVADYPSLTQEAIAAPSHDFGKICVPLEILKKTTPLTLEERDILSHHSLAGYVLLTCYIEDRGHLAARVARDHHERTDGSGYPAGILLSDHLVEIVVVSDIYDALISPRPYRQKSYDNRTALEEICEKADRGELNWDIAETLVACNRKEIPQPGKKRRISREKRGEPPGYNVYGKTAD